MTISTQLNGLETIKSNIRQAIIDKGVAVSVSDAFSVYPDKISRISGGGGGGTNSAGAKRGNVTGDSTGYTGWTENDYIQLPYTFDIDEDWTFKIQIDLTEFPNEVDDLATTAYIWSICTWDNGNDCIWETDGQGHMIPGFAVDYSGYIAGIQFSIDSYLTNYPHPWFEVTHDATNHQTSVKWWIQEGTNISWGPFDDTAWNICNHLCRVGIGAGAQLPSGIKIMTVEYNGEAWTPENWNGVVMRSKEITENGTYNAIADHIDGYTGVSVNVVGVSIPREVSDQGVYGVPASTNFILPDNATTIAPYGLAYAFAYAGNKINSIDFNNVSTINSHGCQNIAYSAGITTVNCESIVTINEMGLYCAFEQCSSMSGVIDFANLVTIESMGMYHAFQLDEHITGVNMPNLETIGYGGMQEAFRASSITTMTFSKLDDVGSYVFSYCFGNSTLSTLSFPALKTTSFNGYTNAFSNMLYGVAGCTVHFPSNLQSVIGSWSDVTNGFGGTNTTVLFDLPATT